MVFDLIPGLIKDELFKIETKIEEKPQRINKTGYKFKRLEKPSNFHDVIKLFLYKDFFEVNLMLTRVLEYIRKFVEQSSFKVKSSS